MTEFLCIGGPLHGQTIEVPVPENGITIQPSAADELLRPADAPPVLPVRYVLRGMAAPPDEDGKVFVRPVMAVEQLMPQQVMMGLAEILVTTWVREGGEEVGTDDSSGGVQRTPGPRGDSGTGTGLIAP